MRCTFRAFEHGVFDQNEIKCRFQIFWKSCFCHTEILCWSRNSGPVVSILPNCCARSKNSSDGVYRIITKMRCTFRAFEHGAFDQNEIKCRFQIFWKSYFCHTEILDQLFPSYRNCCVRSSNSGNGVSDY
jgi:hypothetical protein